MFRSETRRRSNKGLVDKLRPGVSNPQPQPSVVMDGPAMMQGGGMMMAGKPEAEAAKLPPEGVMPPLSGAVEWLNSPPLTREGLKGKVVLIDFWTYSCINCLRSIPYVRAWAEKYKDQGLVVIGVHTPEFAFEKSVANVKNAVADLKIGYPVAIDSNYAIWRAFGNEYWPAHYFIDAEGRIRHHHFGEGDYEESERIIQTLLHEAGEKKVSAGLVSVKASGAEAASDAVSVRSPETYIGYERAENFVSPGGAVRDKPHSYTEGSPRLNEWGLRGDWTIKAEHAVLDQKDGGIVFEFHARDLHLVLGPPPDGKDDPLPRQDRRQGARREPWLGRRSRRPRRCDRAKAVPACPSERTDNGPHFRDPVPGPGCRSLRLHFWLKPELS